MEIELINYIKEAEKHGLSEQEIKKNLLDAGWEASAVEEAFAHTKAMQNQLLGNKDEDINLSSKTVGPVDKEPAVSKTASFNQTSQQVSKFASSPAIKIPTQNLQNVDQLSKKGFQKFAVVFIALIGLLLASGAFGYYKFVYQKSLPLKVWEKFSIQNSSEIFTKKFNLTYTDYGTFESPDSFTNFQLKDLKLNLDGVLYLDSTNIQTPISESEIKYSFSSGNTAFTTDFSYRFVNEVLYINVGENPFLNSLLSSISKNKKIDWLAVDLKKAFSQINNTEGNQNEKIKQFFEQDLQNELKTIFKNTKLIKVESFVGKEFIDKNLVFHFKNTLDKQALKQFINSVIDSLANSAKKAGSEMGKEDQTAIVKEILGEIINKIEIKEFETWVGAKNSLLYKIHLISNSPSIINTAKMVLSESTKKSDDEKRILDIRNFSSAFEQFFKDYGGYPESLNGTPIGLENYLSPIPTPPKSASGACNDYFNNYWYKSLEKIKKPGAKNIYTAYELTFCLGYDTVTYKAGFNKLTPAGIQDNIPCPGSSENCPMSISQQSKPTQTPVDLVKSLNFSAEFKFDSAYSGFAEKKNVKPPENSTDILKLFEDFFPNTATSTTPAL